MMRLEHGSDTQQPLALGSFHNWLKLLWRHRGVDRAYARRAAFVSLVSLLTIPCRLYERARYGRALQAQTITQPPIFILGHWRSGTTYLHYLMCQDPNLGYVSTFQALAPDWFLVGDKTIKPLLRRFIPATRMMDNVTLSLDSPQEEELSIANSSSYSFYHQWSFPRNARYYFDRYVLFEGLPPAVVTAWKERYLDLVRKATYHAGGKRLLLKNLGHTGHIRILLDLFPDAQFIHIHRNPYRVFLSTQNLYEKVLAITQLQRIGADEIETNILQFYKDMMQRYLADRALIPQGNLVEVRFEDLEAGPLTELRRAYTHLGLPDFAKAEPAVRAYLASQGDYEKNRYELTQESIEKVNRHWRFALEQWGYDLPAT